MRTFLSITSLSLVGAAIACATPITSMASGASAAATQMLQPIVGINVPEPSTIAMFVVGASVLALKLRRR